MTIQNNIPLKNYSGMRLGGPASYLATVSSKEELVEAVKFAGQEKLPLIVLGEGSNVIVRDEGYKGLVIINRIPGFQVAAQDDGTMLITIGAGEVWDSVVERTVQLGLSGIESLSYIPGTAGATPVQNVGAYGTEIVDVFNTLNAYDIQTKQFVTLNKEDCHFAYRNSIFKPIGGRHYIIVSVTLRLHTTPPQPPFYDSLQKYLDEHHIQAYSAQVIRDAVIAIRKSKLPDPKEIANNGSFFKNPIVSRAQFETLEQTHPGIPHYEMKDGTIKLLAGWLIDQSGLKGYASHGMQVYPENALVFVNRSAAVYNDLLQFKQEVIRIVQQKFDVTLEQEPELL